MDIRDYGWTAETWEKLLDSEPWFHIRVKVPAKVPSPKVYWRGGGGYKADWYHQEFPSGEHVFSVPAPWLNQERAHDLSRRVNSAVPIVRYDWFMNQSGQENRIKTNAQQVEVGYYQWLNVKTGKDVEDLAGLDRKKKRSILKEVAGIVEESGVGINSRQVFRFPALGGNWWETRDVKESGKNALRQLDGEFKADALEIYFELPNGLYGFALLNDKNELQGSAPDTIVSDAKTTNKDGRVRVGVSCIRCHVEGLRPIDDWARQTFTADNELGLGSPDEKVYKRLKQLYLGPLERSLGEDRNRYSQVLQDEYKMKPAELSKTFAAAWYDYESKPLTPADVAREVGLPEKEYRSRLDDYVKRTGTVDTVLGGLKSGRPTRREHLEELLPILMPALGVAK